MKQKKMKNIIRAPKDIFQNATKQITSQIKSTAEPYVPKRTQPLPEATGTVTPNVEPPSYATPTAINRVDTLVTTSKVPPYAAPTQINRMDTQVVAPKVPPLPSVETVITPTQINRMDAETVYQDLMKDRDKVTTVVTHYQTGVGDMDAVIDALAELQEKYGVTGSDFAAYVNGDQEGAVRQLYDQLPAPRKDGPEYRSALRAVTQARQAETEAEERYNAAADNATEQEELRDLLAPFSTSHWEHRIVDQYAKKDIDGVVSPTAIYSAKVQLAREYLEIELRNAEKRRDEAARQMNEGDIDIGETDGTQPQGDSVAEVFQWQQTQLDADQSQKQQEYLDAVNKCDELKRKLTLLSNLDYQLRNQSTGERVGKDIQAVDAYQTTREIDDDLEKLTTVARHYQDGSGDIGEVSQAVEYLGKKYGVIGADFAAYANGDMTGVVAELYRQLENQIEEKNQKMQEKGYDLADFRGYVHRLEKQEQAAQQVEKVAQFANKVPVVATGATILASPLQFIDGLAMDWGKGKPGERGYIPPDSSGMTLVNAINIVRSTVGHGIYEKLGGGTIGKAARFLYHTGTSIGDSAVAIATLGPYSVYLMGTNSAVVRAKEVVDNGGTAEQAFRAGLAAGAAEVLFEKFSVDNLLKPRTISGWKSVLREMAKQSGVEASEEMLTELANIMSDAVILGDSSQSAQAMRYYQGRGMSEEEAKRQVLWDNIKQVSLSGVGGALSGGVMFSGKTALDYVRQGGAQSLSNTGKKLIETIQSIGTDITKTASTGETESTAINTNPATHTPEQQATIKEYQEATDGGILAFISRWRGLKDPNYRKKVRIDIAPVDQRTTHDIMAAVGVDVSDFTGHSLSGNALEHIDLRHGESGEADHSMADPNDIARMGYVLEHYDRVEALLTKDGKPVLSGEYYNADGSRAPMVRFQKRVDGTYYVVEAVPDAATRELRVVSAYLQKGSDGTGQELTYHRSGPQLTPKTHLDAHTIAKGSISDLLQKVKSTAEEMVERPEGLPESLLEQFRPLLEKRTVEAERAVLAKLLGRPDAAQAPTLAQFLDQQLAAAKEYVRLQALDLSSEMREHYRSALEQGEEAVQWIVDHVQQAQGHGGIQKQSGHRAEGAEGSPQQDMEVFTDTEDHDKMISGALNPESARAGEHAERYYEEVRRMTTDVAKIAKTTGYSETEIQAVKEFLFLEEHDLGGKIQRFYPDFMIAQSWQRLAAGTPEPHDLTLLRHEIMERNLMALGYTQAEAHAMTSKVYNYKKEAIAFYGQAKKHKEN